MTPHITTIIALRRIIALLPGRGCPAYAAAHPLPEFNDDLGYQTSTAQDQGSERTCNDPESFENPLPVGDVPDRRLSGTWANSATGAGHPGQSTAQRLSGLGLSSWTVNRKTGFIATAAGIGLFAAWVWSGIGSHVRVECELCLEFEGRRACRTALGSTSDEASTAARDAACAVLSQGVNEAFACGRMAPDSVTCRER
jgi:hypothetical protein